MTDAAAISTSTRPSFWRRRVLTPLIDQLRQGITPEKIAFTIALGFALSLFPLLGATTLLAAGIAFLLRLNQPIFQLVNYAGYPLQLILLIPFYRAGESLFHQPHVPLSIPLFIERIQLSFPQFLRDFGLIALEGIAVWLLLAPPLVSVLYLALRTPLRALARQPSAG